MDTETWHVHMCVLWTLNNIMLSSVVYYSADSGLPFFVALFFLFLSCTMIALNDIHKTGARGAKKSMGDLFIRDFDDDKKEKIRQKMPTTAKSGHTSPLSRWCRAMIYVGAITDTERSIASYALWQRSLQIAKKRHENQDMRSYPTVLSKLDEENRELYQALIRYIDKQITYAQLVSRLCNILYYAVYQYVLDGREQALEETCKKCALVDIEERVAFLCANEKYADRAEREMKDEAAELARIERVLVSYCATPKLVGKALDE
jgi:hypothetical protein